MLLYVQGVYVQEVSMKECKQDGAWMSRFDLKVCEASCPYIFPTSPHNVIK
jgi:hypothetical protein